MPRKSAGSKGSKGRHAATRRAAPPKRFAARADKGEGESAVQARIAALQEPSRSILARLHPLVMKHAKGLDPAVRYGFAIYMREGKMVLVAAPRKSYVSFGYTNDSGIAGEPVQFTSADQVSEAQVADMVRRLGS